MKQQPKPERIPESMGPTEIGQHLRRLREQFNLSHHQVSERLHIRVRYIAAIEDANFAAMPGKIYARGYVHSYAEFLGLDPDQVALQCFPATTAAAPLATSSAKPVISTVQPRLASATGAKRSGGGFWAIVLVGAMGTLAVGYALQPSSVTVASPQTEALSSVAPIPESMLQSLRSEVMPTQATYDCYNNTYVLSCWFAQQSVQQLLQFDTEKTRPFAGEIAAALSAPPPVPEPDSSPAHTQEEIPDAE